MSGRLINTLLHLQIGALISSDGQVILHCVRGVGNVYNRKEMV